MEVFMMRENRNLEFKESIESNTFLKTISAFANILEGSNLSFEEISSEKQELEFRALETEMVQILGICELNTDILKTLELYSEKDGFNNAAALLADNNNFKGIDMIRFGDSIDEIMDRVTFDGVSIITQLENAVEMFRKYYQYEKIEGTSRMLVEKIPEKAFREAIANALVHRQWDVNAFIKVSMYSDRIEITSPGGLPAGISKEEYLKGQISLLRNPIIGNVFFRLKYIEKFGTGILRINHAYENALMKPSYRIFENSITVSLPVISAENKLTIEERKVVELLEGHTSLSRKEIEQKTGFNKDKVIRILNGMLEKNIIGKVGVGRGTKYRML